MLIPAVLVPDLACVSPSPACVRSGAGQQAALPAVVDLGSQVFVVQVLDLAESVLAERRERRGLLRLALNDGLVLTAVKGAAPQTRLRSEITGSEALFGSSAELALGTLVTGVLAEPVTSERPVRRARTNTVH